LQSNFALSLNRKLENGLPRVYIIDFGLSRKYQNSEGKIKEVGIRKKSIIIQRRRRRRRRRRTKNKTKKGSQTCWLPWNCSLCFSKFTLIECEFLIFD